MHVLNFQTITHDDQPPAEVKAGRCESQGNVSNSSRREVRDDKILFCSTNRRARMLLSTPLRKGTGPATRSQLPVSGGSFSTADLCSTLIVDTPASTEKGFFATSFDSNCASARKHLFVVSPDHSSSQGLDLLHDGDGQHQPSFRDAEEDSIRSTTCTSEDITSLILKAEQKLSVIRLSLEKALRTAKRVRTLASANKDREETAAVEEKGDAGEPHTFIHRPRRGIPLPLSIEEERNLRLVADLVLTPGKTLTLSP